MSFVDIAREPDFVWANPGSGAFGDRGEELTKEPGGIWASASAEVRVSVGEACTDIAVNAPDGPLSSVHIRWKGSIASTNVLFYDMFNYGAYLNWDPRKADMTLEDALTMRLGIEWDEWTLPYSNPNNDLVFLNNNNTDWAKALLDLPMSSAPGTIFTYNTAATTAIGQALENATGIPMADFANQYLFYPMDITTAEWGRTPTGLPNGGSGLFLLPRDMAKFGQLFIDDGVWQGQQLISPAWIADSVERRVDISSWSAYSEAYGLQWWLDDFNHQGQDVPAYVTAGYGGQYIFALPDLDLIVAFTGQNYGNGAGVANLYVMIQDYILQSIN